MYSLVISTIGCPFLLDSLSSLVYPPDDIIVVVDMVGRRAAPRLETEWPLANLETDIGDAWPDVRIMYNEPSGPWAVMNQCYNIGWKAAFNPFVWFTHDDIEYPDFDFPTALRPTLSRMHHGESAGRRVVGLVLPEYEVTHRVTVPNHPRGSVGLTQFVSPVSQVVSVQAMREMGGFDETDGIWYDGQLEAESGLRDWWYLLMDTPAIRHTSNRTYVVNNWGDRWKANPIWGNYAANFAKRYGSEWTRDLNAPLLPVEAPV